MVWTAHCRVTSTTVMPVRKTRLGGDSQNYLTIQ